MKKKYIFGPISSRRLGRSLGVDLIPFKTCSLDCIYCEQGKTTALTTEIKEWFPLKDVLKDIKETLPTNPDFITISGSGEPTLYSRMKDLIHEIKKMTDIPVAVITNGTMLWKPEVRDSLLKADVVMPSLDAGFEESYLKINKPHKSITFDMLLKGLVSFRSEFNKQYWLEILFIKGINDSEKELSKMKEIIEKINPDKILLNSIKRPPSEKWAEPVSSEKLLAVSKYFGPKAEVICNSSDTSRQSSSSTDKKKIINLLKRRPCTLKEIAHGLSFSENDTHVALLELISTHAIEKNNQGNEVYYNIL